MRAIETHYNGYRFRSRLEARWAVFLDALGIAWEYEAEGYVLDDGTWYLPDFFLPYFDGGIHFEVKPERVPDEEDRKILATMRAFARSVGSIVLLRGAPKITSYICFTNGDWYPVCFHENYLPGMRNGEQRLFYAACEEDIEWGNGPKVEAAIITARSARFSRTRQADNAALQR